MSVDRYPLTRDNLSALLHARLETWAEDVGQPAASDLPQDAYDQQATGVLDLLRKLRIGVEPIGIKEMAERMNTTRKTVDTWRERRGVGFPEPRWTVGGRPSWDWCDIEEWGDATGRRRANGVWAPVGDLVAP